MRDHETKSKNMNCFTWKCNHRNCYQNNNKQFEIKWNLLTKQLIFHIILGVDFITELAMC